MTNEGCETVNAVSSEGIEKGGENMQTITVKVPNMIADIRKSEQEEILESAIRHVIFSRLAEKRRKYKAVNRKIAALERRYGMNFKEFSDTFPDGAGLSQHEHWVEWSHYQEVRDRLGALIKKMEQIGEH